MSGMVSQEDADVFRVTDVQYEENDDGVSVDLFGRSLDGRRIHKVVTGIVPYLFVSDRDFDIDTVKMSQFDEKNILDINRGFNSYKDEDLVQLVVHQPSQITQLRNIFTETFESDIPFERRCTADYNLTGYVKTPKTRVIEVDAIEPVDKSDVEQIDPRGAIVDIEVRIPDTFYNEFAEDAPNEVTAITAYDTYTEEYTLFCLDSEMQVDPGMIREYIEQNWSGHDDEERLVSEDIVFKRYGNEINMLKSFVEYIQDTEPDYLSGWNYVNFDHEYLYNRIDEKLSYMDLMDLSPVGRVGGYKTETYIDGIPAIDMMEAYTGKLRYGEMKSKSLEYVSSQLLGVGKIEGDDNAYDKNRTKFMAYNVVDVQLCVEINRQYNVMDFWFMISEVTGIPAYDVGSTMKECEGYLFLQRDNDEILPDTEEKEMNTISGGFVMPPSNGVEEWVGVVDLKSLYPSSIISCNISKETMTYDTEEADVIVPNMPLNYEDVPGNKIRSSDIDWEMGEGACVGFDLSKEGILPKYLKQLFKNREEMKSKRDQYDVDDRMYEVYDMQQRALKVVMNSFFGVSDNPYFRLSADGLGAAITSVSRYVSWLGIQAIESDGYNVRYGDTDSLFIELLNKDGLEPSDNIDTFVDSLTELEGNINDRLKQAADTVGIPEQHPHFDGDLHGTEQHLWVYEAEKLYRRFLQTGAKKRYAGNIVWKEGKYVDKTDVSGFETVKSDSAGITQDVQEQFIEKILDGQEYDELTEYIQQQIDGLRSGRFELEYIGFPSSLNKPIEEYPNMPVKRATKYSNEHLGYDWGSGDDPWLVYVDMTPYNLPSTDVIALSWQDEDIPDGFEINMEKHLDKSIKGPLQSIIDSLDFSWKELKTGQKEQSVLGGGGGEITFDDAAETDTFNFDE